MQPDTSQGVALTPGAKPGVMALLTVAHLAFWGWGSLLAIQAGSMVMMQALLAAAWLGGYLFITYRIGILSRSGWLTGDGLKTWPGLWVPSLATTLSVFAFMSVPPLLDGLTAATAALPLSAIPALHSVRLLAFGTVRKARDGTLPRRIGYGVGLPDTAFGAISFVILLTATPEFYGSGFEIAWHVSGMLILLAMMPMLHTSLGRNRLSKSGTGDGRAVLRWPMVLAPAGLASLFLIAHGLRLVSIAYGLPNQN